MTVLPFHSPADAAAAAARVAAHLAAGGILAYPTETVYGFGTALDPAGLARLVKLKGREAHKPFLLLADDPLGLPALDWTPAARQLAESFWPGPLSLALAAGTRYREPVRSKAGTVAVRDTPHPSLRRLLARLGQPLTSTSVNRPGQAPATNLRDVLEVLGHLPGGERVLVLDGGVLPASLPSTVVDCSGERPRLVREGAIPLPELQSVLDPRGIAIDVG